MVRFAGVFSLRVLNPVVLFFLNDIRSPSRFFTLAIGKAFLLPAFVLFLVLVQFVPLVTAVSGGRANKGKPTN